jgi:hypothetical protein
MAKTASDIRSLARSHTGTAIRTLVGIMRQQKAPPAARVAAASAILDRGWGKPAQTLEHTGKDGPPIEVKAVMVPLKEFEEVPQTRPRTSDDAA